LLLYPQQSIVPPERRAHEWRPAVIWVASLIPVTLTGVDEPVVVPFPSCPSYYATTLAAEDVPIQEIEARLGHASIETPARRARRWRQRCR
jgi:hypothetical protein